MNPDPVQVAVLGVESTPISVHESPVLDDSEAYEPTYSYDEVFPALPETEASREPQQTDLGQWNQRMKVQTSIITQVFRVPVEERRFKEISSQRFGEQGEQAKICADIMQKTGAHIEVSSSKDQSLTILVTGKADAVLKARRSIINELQTQANVTILIPKEHHRFILGKNGKKLAELELNTATKIMIPRPEENSNEIRITGTKEGIDKARHEIQLTSDEQAKLAFNRLNIPKIYHPFISGAHGETLNQLMETGARINIPPPSVMKDEITIAGEKDAVAKATEAVLLIYDEKKKRCQTVQVEVRKCQHKYVIGHRGQGIQKILEETGVSVEVPSSDSTSETITLRGEQDKLGLALSMLYKKANSVIIAEVAAPSWLHKFIIGRKGANIKQITQDLTKVHVEFTDGQDKMKIEGPPEEVEEAQKKLEDVIRDLMSRIVCEEIWVDPKYHRHIIGKNGANVTRLKQETGISIHIPSDADGNGAVRIEGSPTGVEQAKKELLDMVHKMENEVQREVKIEQRFHRQIIGTKGDSIKEVRDKFNSVSVTFPEPGIKSDTVLIRGPKQDVDNCFHFLSEKTRELVVNNYKSDVQIMKQHLKFVAGKARANIRKIQQETDTKIDLPPENSDCDVISITGRKENVQLAREKILELQSDQASAVQVDLMIPAKFHNSMIGSKGRLIRSIAEECGNISIRFPPEGSGSDKVSLRGPKEFVDKAKKQLLELTNEKQLNSYTAEVKAKPEHHKFLIGRSGVNINKVRNKTGARIIFPSEKDDDRESIIIMGKKESVLEARKELEDMIKDLDKVVESEMRVDPKHHRHFVARRGEVLKQIAEEYGGVAVSFPRSGINSDRVILKGARECVEGAKQRIQEIVLDLDSMVTIECLIPQMYHRTVMGSKGYKVQGITQDYCVQIKFPDRETREDMQNHENGDESAMNGEVEIDSNSDHLENEKHRKSDTIYITGKRENCEAAKEALMALVPITIELQVPYDLHRFIIGQKGKEVREMMEMHDVNISVPPASEQSDVIKINGPPSNVENAKEALLKRVQQLEDERQDRILRSFQRMVEVDPKYHPKIIGRKGAVISKIRTDHKVQIQFPERGDANENIITIIGYERNTEAAAEAVLKIVQDLESMLSEEVHVDRRVHSRLIGVKGRNIRKVMDQYKVDIRFPRSTDPDPDLVVISGTEAAVEEAKDYVLNLEEEYLQDINDAEMLRQYTHPPRGPESEGGRSKAESKGFVVKGGPWEQSGASPAPDTTSTQEFPSFGSTDAPKAVVWGPRR